jgi:hypothetical protein
MDIKSYAALVAGGLIAYLIRRIVRRHVDGIRAMRPRKTEDRG